MKKQKATLLMICLASLSVASTYSVTLASDPTSQVSPGKRVHGSTGWYDGYRLLTVNGQVVREYCGWKTYDWDRTNLTSLTYLGYTVVTSAVDFEPDSGLVSHFYTPATVLFGEATPVDPEDPLNEAID